MEAGNQPRKAEPSFPALPYSGPSRMPSVAGEGLAADKSGENVQDQAGGQQPSSSITSC